MSEHRPSAYPRLAWAWLGFLIALIFLFPWYALGWWWWTLLMVALTVTTMALEEIQRR